MRTIRHKVASILRRATNDSDETREVATTVRRLAVMVGAGLPAAKVWEHLPGAGDLGARSALILADCDDAVRVGDDVSAALIHSVRHRFSRPRSEGAASSSWRGLAATLTVAERCGSPLASCLARLAASFDDNAENRRSVDAALAAPRSTARLMMWLPAASLLLGALLGFDSLRILTGTAIGIVCGLLGASLAVIAGFWSARLVRQSEPQQHSPGLVLDLVSLAVGGGGSMGAARMLVADTIERCGLREHDELARAQRSLDLAEIAGIPAAELVSADADLVRAENRLWGAKSAARLSVRLMLPLGCCTLPSFVLLGVVPLILSIVSLVV